MKHDHFEEFEKNNIKCLNGLTLEDINNNKCAEDCQFIVFIGSEGKDCLCGCLKCNGEYIETVKGLMCSYCGDNAII